jgi:HTH-type transcriptional regulator / antitoxin HipB
MVRANREQRLTTERQAVELLRSRRKARAISQRELASKLGVTQARLSELESGRAHVTLERLLAIARLLELEVVVRERPTKSPTTEW